MKAYEGGKTYTHINQAMEECTKINGCKGVANFKCRNNKYKLCKSGPIKDLSSNSHCVHQKLESKCIYYFSILNFSLSLSQFVWPFIMNIFQYFPEAAKWRVWNLIIIVLVSQWRNIMLVLGKSVAKCALMKKDAQNGITLTKLSHVQCILTVNLRKVTKRYGKLRNN